MLDLWRNNDKLTWRKLGVLIDQLPPESALAREQRLEIRELPPGERPTPGVRDPEREQWSRNEELLAMVRDELVNFRWMYAQLHSDKPLQWTPDPLPRPGVALSKSNSLDDIQVNHLAQHLARTQASEGEDSTYV